MRRKILLPAAMLLLCGGFCVAGDNEVSGWEELRASQFSDAMDVFSKMGEGSEREGRLGQALALINLQPRVAGNIVRAKELLDALISENSRDTAGYIARLTKARLLELYLHPAAPEEARGMYAELLKEGSGNPIAEAAASRLVLSDLYEDVSAEEMSRRVRALLAYRIYVKTPGALRDFDFSLGMTLSRLGIEPQLALDALLNADAVGFALWQNQADAWATIADVAMLLHQSPVAARYYRKFVEKFTRDPRTFTFSQRLREIEE